MDLVKRLEEFRDRERGLQWEGTFAQYFEIATKKPEVAHLSHERIYHMIMDEDVPVKRIAFSEKYRVGVGTFTPSDPKSQDISELVGGIDLSTIGEVGVESDPRAYRFDGELNIANRGLMEFVEMLKTDEKFLYVL